MHTLGNSNILRTVDVCPGAVLEPEIEDLLRETLITMAKIHLGWDITDKAARHPHLSVVEIFNDEIPDFSKYRLAKTYLGWLRDRSADDLAHQERDAWKELINRVNRALE